MEAELSGRHWMPMLTPEKPKPARKPLNKPRKQQPNRPRKTLLQLRLPAPPPKGRTHPIRQPTQTPTSASNTAPGPQTNPLEASPQRRRATPIAHDTPPSPEVEPNKGQTPPRPTNAAPQNPDEAKTAPAGDPNKERRAKDHQALPKMCQTIHPSQTRAPILIPHLLPHPRPTPPNSPTGKRTEPPRSSLPVRILDQPQPPTLEGYN